MKAGSDMQMMAMWAGPRAAESHLKLECAH